MRVSTNSCAEPFFQEDSGRDEFFDYTGLKTSFIELLWSLKAQVNNAGKVRRYVRGTRTTRTNPECSPSAHAAREKSQVENDIVADRLFVCASNMKYVICIEYENGKVKAIGSLKEPSENALAELEISFVPDGSPCR